MDAYSKMVLTIIAIALVGLNVQTFRSTPAEAGLFDRGPTIGDLEKLENIENDYEREQAENQTILRVPLVRVIGTVSLK